MRIGDYEVRRCNDWCMQLFAVMPEGFDNARAKYRVADDGRALKPLDCYPSTVAAALRRIGELEQRTTVDGIDLAGAIERLESCERRISALADELGVEL